MSGQRNVIIKFRKMKVLGLVSWMVEVNEVRSPECQDDLTVEDSVPGDATKNPLRFYFLGSTPPQTEFSVNEEPRTILRKILKH